MQPQAAQTVQQVVDGVISTAGIIAAVATPITIQITQGIKSLVNTRFIGLISSAVGFLVAILFGRLFDGAWFGVFNSAVAIVVSVGAPGVFSVIKATANPQSVDPVPSTVPGDVAGVAQPLA